MSCDGQVLKYIRTEMVISHQNHGSLSPVLSLAEKLKGMQKAVVIVLGDNCKGK